MSTSFQQPLPGPQFRCQPNSRQTLYTSLLASVVGAHALHGTAYTVGGEVGLAQGNHHPAIAPYGLFETSDGPVQISVANDKLWQAFCNAFGLDAQAVDYATNLDRVTRRDQLVAMINDAFSTMTRDEVLAKLNQAGIPAGKVRTIDEVYTWDQVASQHLLRRVHHPVLGEITIPGSPLRYDDNQYSGGRPEFTHPPLLGEHDASVRAWLADTEETSA